MIADVWEQIEDGVVVITVVPNYRTGKELSVILGEEPAKKLREIEGETWEEIMTKHHEIMGWEPYKPF